jgi:glycosyltransferase involved in cell wall biosynthesis
MKNIHLIFSLRTGGTENMLVDIVNEQCLHAEVTLYIVNDVINYDILRRLSENAHVKQFNRRPGSRNPLPLLSLNAALLKERGDIIHCHNYNMIDLLLPVFRKKAVLTIHNTISRPIDFTRYHRCFAISAAVQESLRVHAGAGSKVVQNGVAFSAIKARGTHNREGVFRVLQTGRLDHQTKGQHTAIMALGILKKRGITNVQIDFIGEGNSANYLKQLSREQEVAAQVRFLGLRDRSYVYQQLQQYDLLIQPSLYEGFGLTIVEAMAARVPVLVSDIDGPLEVIEKGRYGYYFRKENAEDMAARIADIMNTDTTQITTMAEGAYWHARKNFDIRNTALNYLQEYHTYA